MRLNQPSILPEGNVDRKGLVISLTTYCALQYVKFSIFATPCKGESEKMLADVHLMKTI